MTATPFVSRYSMVRLRSSMLFAPAETTVTLVLDSSSRSADMSIVFSAPLCTPPMPPVAKILTPAFSARIIVLATVVAPLSPFAMTMGISLRDTLVTVRPAFPSFSISSRLHPTVGTPSMIAMVAGTAPFFLTSSSTLNAVSTF